jgi:hypothetical protein
MQYKSKIPSFYIYDKALKSMGLARPKEQISRLSNQSVKIAENQQLL